ncbi:hypothetical protein [Bacillus sp. AFS017274]|uniref:hypothetical protein n=1 Tax=Bacillus sp. AFS017274 TaxID=2033488 RepID=UPI000BF74281|nr:hypothetical protein [Bacillus sp. AFS017274]PEZ76374.1 hypothetical protein CN380_21515 [Bacillus sp. AFS017274]
MIGYKIIGNFASSVKIIEENGVRTIKVFQIIMSESADQRIKSDSGTGYEIRIENHLIQIGIQRNNIEALNHEEVGSIEHDFKFEFEERQFGISSKRSLRKRYKQYVNLLLGFANQELLEGVNEADDEFIPGEEILEEYGDDVERVTKESIDVDVLMTITIGADLTEKKARTIRSFGVYIFVSPEIYNTLCIPQANKWCLFNRRLNTGNFTKTKVVLRKLPPFRGQLAAVFYNSYVLKHILKGRSNIDRCIN